MKRITTTLPPLPPEGDISQSLGLLLKYEDKVSETTRGKLHTKAAVKPVDWLTPDLAILLVDRVSLPIQVAIMRSIADLGPNCLCVILCQSDDDRESLYTTLTCARASNSEYAGIQSSSN